jgi:hypothetical protein
LVNFDLTQFRAFQYDPSDIDGARGFIVTFARDRLRAVDQSKSEYVKRCVEALDPLMMHFLLTEVPVDDQPFSISVNLMNAARCPKLFELGILRTTSVSVQENPENNNLAIVHQAMLTPLGREIKKLIVQRV